LKAYAQLACIALALLLPLGALQLDLTRKQQVKQPFPDRAPDTVGEWRAVGDSDLPPEALDLLAPEAYSMRYYEAANRPPIWIYAAFYRGVESGAPHDPMICYPAAGWSIAEDNEAQLELGNSESFPVRFMRGELSGADELVLYWRQPVGRWPGRMPVEFLARLRDRVLGSPNYAFIRISLRRPRSLDGVSESDMQALHAMAVALAPWARDAVSSGPAL
jgi:EpsI family protein